MQGNPVDAYLYGALSDRNVDDSMMRVRDLYAARARHLVFCTAFALCAGRNANALDTLEACGLSLAALLGMAVKQSRTDWIRAVATCSPQRTADGTWNRFSAINGAIFRAGVFGRVAELLLYRKAGMEIPPEQAALLPPPVPAAAAAGDAALSDAAPASAASSVGPSTATVALAAIKADMAAGHALTLLP